MEFYWEFSIQHVWCKSLSFRLTTASKGEEGKNQILWFIVKFKCPIFHLSTDKHFGFSSLDLESPSGILSIFCQPRKKTIPICCVPMCETFSVWSAKWLVRYTNKGWGVFSGRKLNGRLVDGKFPFYLHCTEEKTSAPTVCAIYLWTVEISIRTDQWSWLQKLFNPICLSGLF